MRPYLITALILGIVAMVGLTGFLLIKSLGATKVNNQTASVVNPQPSTISGKFDINGVIPPGTTITVSKREYKSSSDFTVVSKDIIAKDEAIWSITDSIAGKTYEITSTTYADSVPLATSSAITVTAPATSQVLVLNISGDTTSQISTIATISGSLRINGYIPSGSTISVVAKNTADSTSTTVINGVNAKASQVITYTSAVAGQTYQLIGYLYDSTKKQIGVSTTLTLTAPAADESLTINSTATQPAGTTSQSSSTQASTSAQISGSITFNGIAPTNSRIAIFQKVYNATSYQLATDNITPVNGATWQWSSAKSATWYNIIAILKQRQSDGTDKDIATSTSVSVAAPGTSVVLTVNSNIAIPAPSGTITVLCTGVSGNYWNAQLTIPAVTGALSYWYQVGTYSGGNNVASTTLNASGTGDQTATVQINSKTAYYFRYAYANVANVSGSSSQFSPFSGDSQANCGN